jgi:hypothetical protein
MLEEAGFLEPEERENIVEERAERDREDEENQQFFYTLRARRVHELRVKSLAENIIRQVKNYKTWGGEQKLDDVVRWATRIQELENDV